MLNLILYFVVMSAAMLGISKLLPGFQVNGWGPALIATFVLGIVNVIVKPILFVLTLPLTIVTLGLFLFVINAICLWLTALLVPGFRVEGFGTTLLASLLLAVVSLLWKSITASAPRQPEVRS
jgi:putative membrane protein